MERARAHRARGLLVFLSLLAATVATTVPVGPAGAATSGEQAPEQVPGELLVRFRPGVPEHARDRAVAGADARTVRTYPELDARLLRIDESNTQGARKRLQHDPSVLYVEPNYVVHADVVPDDPDFDKLWALHNTGQTGGEIDADIDAPAAWDLGTSAAGVVVGVIDSGVDFGHPDLGGSRTSSPLLWTNAGEVAGNGVDDDENGYVDDVHGWDWVNNDNDATDDNGHGTHVSGTIGAMGNNATGITGVSWSGLEIMPLKFLSAQGSGSTSNAVSAVLYAARNGAHITNNSWGGGGYSQLLADAIKTADDAGSLFVASAGNDGTDTDSIAHYPSSYEAPNLVSVAATTHTDAKASFSNYGADSVDLGAPGASILSTWLDNTYKSASGTSMASPHVTGVAALVKARFPAATDLTLKGLLLDTVDPNTAMAGITRTGGRLNLATPMGCSGLSAWVEEPAAGFGVGVGDQVMIQVAAGDCGHPTGVSVVADWNGTPVTLTDRGDGLFTGTYVPDAVGSATVTVTAAKSGETSITRTRVGSVHENYRYLTEPYALVDASDGGTNSGLTSDDGSVTVNLPFAFPYYGQSYTDLKIASNGYVLFGGGTVPGFYSPSPIPDIAEPNGVVAPFWSDLNPSAGGGIYHRTVGTEGSRRFVVTWKDVPHYVELSFGRSVGAGTFEVILEEATGDMVFQYADVVFGDSRYDYGASATVGVERPDGLVGREYSRNQAVLQNGTALRFTNGASTNVLPVPRNLTAASAPAGAIDLSWTAPDGGAPTGGYNVYRTTTSGSYGEPFLNTPDLTLTDTPPDDGLYLYVVTAVHETGESDQSNEVSAQSDREAPLAPTGLAIAAGDGWTEDHVSAANVGATVVDGGKTSDTVEVVLTFADSVTSVGRTISGLGTGTTFVDPTGADLAGLADGTVTVTAVARDQAGNTSTASEVLSAVKDVVAPTVTIDSGPTGTTDATTAEFAFSSSESGTSFTCTLDGGSPETCTSGHSYSDLADGDHTFTVVGADAAGNTGSDSRTWTVATSTSTGGSATADGEIAGAGSVSGTYVDTQFDDGATQSITEVESGGKPSLRHSYLEHTWTFSVASGATGVTLSVDAVASGSELFEFQYSVDGGATWQGGVTINSTSGLRTGTLADGTGGTVHVRVRDVDRSDGRNSFDTITVDWLQIDWTGTSDTGSPPPDSSTAPISLTATPEKVKGVQQTSLSWEWVDSATPPTTYDIYRGDGVLTDVSSGSLILDAVPGPSDTDFIGAKGSATYTYWVCADNDLTRCSDPAHVTF